MFEYLIHQQDAIIFAITLFIFLASIIISFQTGFIQLRGFLYMLKLLREGLFGTPKEKVDEKHILPIQSLFTAMSTSIGIGNIVGPIVALKLGGVGAVFGFLMAMLFGASCTFLEVYIALKTRKETKEGVFGGPMQYLSQYLGTSWASLYAFSAGILLCSWCASQSNTLADFFASYGVPHLFSGAFLSLVIFFILIGGIRRVAEFASSVVPWMFVLYSLCCLWIIAIHYSAIPGVFQLIFRSLGSFTEMGSGMLTGLMALRWGLAKGYQSNESGLGTSSIPHSMAGGTQPFEQAILAMAAVFSNGILCLLTLMVMMVTGAWQSQHLGIGINILKELFQQHFFMGGELVLGFCSTLFVLTTILGNAYNGSQAFGYFTKHKGYFFYYGFISLFVFLGSLIDAELAWTFIDYLLIPLALPHVIGLLRIASLTPEIKSKRF